MAQKKYSLYNSRNVEGDQQLAVEIGKRYIAVVLGTADHIAGFEYYDSDDSDLEELLQYVKQHSQLLDKPYSDTRLFYNLDEAVLLPVGQFNTSVTNEYLDLAFGNKPNCQVNVENINVQPGIVNVYRSDADWQHIINQYFRAVAKRHLFSRMVENGAVGITVQFYENEMAVVAINNKQLQLARNFAYQSDEDIIYHLLNVCKQTGIDPVSSNIKVSGFIDKSSAAFQMLGKYFGNPELVTAESVMPGETLSSYPLHYFTHFFKLLT